jgi:hypothetical protein
MRLRLLIAPLLATALSAQAAGTVQVDFVEPARYTDAGRSTMDTERNTRSLAEFVQRRLAPQLPDGQVLAIDVTDIDLAGSVRFGRLGDVRVARGGADWPRITLRWTLSENGRTVKTGDETLADMNYLAHVPRAYLGDTDLPYEKRLLADWFDHTFARPQP